MRRNFEFLTGIRAAESPALWSDESAVCRCERAAYVSRAFLVVTRARPSTVYSRSTTRPRPEIYFYSGSRARVRHSEPIGEIVSHRSVADIFPECIPRSNNVSLSPVTFQFLLAPGTPPITTRLQRREKEDGLFPKYLAISFFAFFFFRNFQRASLAETCFHSTSLLRHAERKMRNNETGI